MSCGFIDDPFFGLTPSFIIQHLEEIFARVIIFAPCLIKAQGRCVKHSNNINIAQNSSHSSYNKPGLIP